MGGRLLPSLLLSPTYADVHIHACVHAHVACFCVVIWAREIIFPSVCVILGRLSMGAYHPAGAVLCALFSGLCFCCGFARMYVCLHIFCCVCVFVVVVVCL